MLRVTQKATQTKAALQSSVAIGVLPSALIRHYGTLSIQMCESSLLYIYV